MWDFSLKLRRLHEKLYYMFHYFKFYYCGLLSLEIRRFTKIIDFDTSWIIPISYNILYIYLR